MSSNFILGDWTVYPKESVLKQGTIVVSIEPKVMELLVLLAEADGELVSRHTIMEKIWHGRYVTDFALNSLVSSLRKYLSQHSDLEYIKTKPKLGYQLIQSVNIVTEPELTSATMNQATMNQATTNQATTNQAKIEDDSLITPNKTKRNILYSAIVVFCMAVAVAYFNFASKSPSSFESQSLYESQSLEPSIAVLPFTFIGDDEDVLYFTDGLAEEIIHQLTSSQELKVISKSSSSIYKNTEFGLSEVGERLGVNYVLQGSVRFDGELMRVTVQLSNAVKGVYLWSQTFTGSKDSVFDIQNQISNEIALSFDTTLLQNANEGEQEISSQAYLHVLKGRKYNQQKTNDSLLNARNEFLMATKLQPNYAMAYVDLSVSYLLMAQNKMLSLEESSKSAQDAIETALSIDPNLAEAYAAKGILAFNKSDIGLAKASFKQALDIDPDNYLALINYGNLLTRNFENEEALKVYQKAIAIAPLSSPANWGLGRLLNGFGYFDAAVQQYQKCVFRLPKDQNCALAYPYSLRLSKQNEQASSAFASTAEMFEEADYYYRMASAWHFLWTGASLEAEKIYEKLIDQFGYDIGALLSINLVKLDLNKQDKWVNRLQKAYSESPIPNLSLKANFAHAAYFNNQCDVAVPIFEELLQSHEQLFYDFELIANGAHYYALLAHCYGLNSTAQSGTTNSDKKQEMLNKLANIIERFPDNQNTVPGFIFLKAKYYLLTGDEANKQAMLQILNDGQWALSWLIEKHPLFAEHTNSNLAASQSTSQ